MEAAKEFSGYNDAQACFDRGEWDGCAWLAASIIPFTRLGKLAKLGKIVENGTDAAKAYCSFSADTHVLMADGTTKPISKIKVGDKVMAKDPETGESGPREVTHLWIHGDELIDLKIGDSVVSTTDDHPFWNATDQQWQQAGQINPGERVLAADGSLVPVGGLIVDTRRSGTAYNLTVNDIHTYYVLAGNTPVLVHNTGCDKHPIGPGWIDPRAKGPCTCPGGTQNRIDNHPGEGVPETRTSALDVAARGTKAIDDAAADGSNPAVGAALIAGAAAAGVKGGIQRIRRWREMDR